MFRLLALTLSLAAPASGFFNHRAVALTRRSFHASPLVMAAGKTATGKTNTKKTDKISDQLDALLQGAPTIPKSVRRA